jgi:hypothetical protein
MSFGKQILGVVGRRGSCMAKEVTACVIVLTVNLAHVTLSSKTFQAVVWHLFGAHPKLKGAQTEWKSAC